MRVAPDTAGIGPFFDEPVEQRLSLRLRSRSQQRQVGLDSKRPVGDDESGDPGWEAVVAEGCLHYVIDGECGELDDGDPVGVERGDAVEVGVDHPVHLPPTDVAIHQRGKHTVLGQPVDHRFLLVDMIGGFAQDVDGVGLILALGICDRGEIEAQLGGVDIVVANATPDQPQKPIELYDWEFYQEMIDFFIKSPFLLARATVPQMKKGRWGRIIQVGSEVFQRGVPNFTAYVAAKGGQNGFTRSLATELAQWNITVNMVSPAWIPVERHENDPQEMKDEYLAGLPAKRWGTPKEVGDTVAFLASDEASYISGQNICVNAAHTVA